MIAPLSDFHTYLKCMRSDAMSDVQRLALRYAFHAFFSEEPNDDQGQDFLERTLMVGNAFVTENGTPSLHGPLYPAEPYKYRRFAGGSSLPRSRYYTLADSRGEDDRTLESELRAYITVDQPGSVRLWDKLHNESLDYIFSDYVHLEARPSPHSMMVLFEDRTASNSLSPLITTLVQGGHIAQRTNVLVELPYIIEEVNLLSVVDLRDAGTQEWFHRMITTGIPGVTYYYPPNIMTNGLHINGDGPIHEEPDIKLDSGGSGKIVWFPPQDNGRRPWRPNRSGANSFLGMLPFLLYRGQGGSPVTEAIGRWLRTIGATGLVFPSARPYTKGVAARGGCGAIDGWNFVDYTDAPTPDLGHWVIMGPDTWVSQE